MLKGCSPCPAVWIASSMMALTVFPARDGKFSIGPSIRVGQRTDGRLKL
jgi:hypothetical protein